MGIGLRMPVQNGMFYVKWLRVLSSIRSLKCPFINSSIGTLPN